MSSVSKCVFNYNELSLILDSSQRSSGRNEDYVVELKQEIPNGYDFYYLRNATIPDAGYFFSTPQSVSFMDGTRITFNAALRYTWQELQNHFQNTFDTILGFNYAWVQYNPFIYQWNVIWNTEGHPFYKSFGYDFEQTSEIADQLGWYRYASGPVFSAQFKSTVANPENYYIRSLTLSPSSRNIKKDRCHVVDRVPSNSGYTASTNYEPQTPRKIYNSSSSTPITSIDLHLTANTTTVYSLNNAPWIAEIVFVYTDPIP